MIHLDQFFGPGNHIRWDKLNSAEGKSQLVQLQPFLDLLSGAAPVVALPRVDEATRSLSWYVLWHDPANSRLVHDLLKAFIGPSFSSLGQRVTTIQGTDMVDRAVTEGFGDRVIRFEVPAKHRDNARMRLLRMLQLVCERPKRTAHRWRAVGRILRDFDLALFQGDGRAALELVNELRGGGHLDAVNLAYLELRRGAALKHWKEVLEHPELSSVLEIGVPRRVAEGVLQAIFHTHLTRFQSPPDPQGAVEQFRESILPKYGIVLRTRQGLTGYEADACFLLLDTVRRSRTENTKIVARYAPGTTEREFLDAISAWEGGLLPPPQPTDPLSSARKHFEDGDVDEAFNAARAAVPSAERTRLMIRCAWEMDTDLNLSIALQAFESLPVELRDRVVRGARWQSRVDNLRLRFGVGTRTRPAAPVESWVSWFDRLRVPNPWPGAIACLEAGSSKWSVEEVASDPATVERIRLVMGATLPDWASEALRRGMPSIIKHFATVPPDVRLEPMLDVAFDLLATDEIGSVPLCVAIVQLASCVLTIGVTPKRYVEVLESVASLLERAGTPSVLPAALEALEVVLAAATGDDQARRAFCGRIAGILSRWWHRLDAADRLVATSLLRDMGLTDALPQIKAPTEVAQPVWEKLVGSSLAIYSLNEAALTRVRHTIAQLCDTARVMVFKEHAGGLPAMREAARNADLFVIVTGAAKHAATTFIETNRPKELPTVYPKGQGSSSILAAIRSWISEIS